MLKRLRQRLQQLVRGSGAMDPAGPPEAPTRPPSDSDDEPVTFDDHFDRLVRLMKKLETLLGDVGEDFWRDWIRKDLPRIENGDRHALDHFLEAFGGTGSFNDLIIHPVNGHEISEEHIDSANHQLGVLRSKAWASAKAMQRELDHH